MKLTQVIIAFLCLGVSTAFAQQRSDSINRVQPTIMVVPYTSKGEDIRTKIESDFSYRTVINTIDKAFQDRGFTTSNFIEALKSSEINQVGNTGVTQTDLWKQIQENATSDIFLYAEVNIYKSPSGNKVQMLLSAVDKFSAQALASTDLLTSNQMYTEDYATLAKQTLAKDDAIGKFLDALNRKFVDISENGRSVEVRLELNNNSQLNFNDEVNSDYDLLSELITNWIKKNAFKNYYHVKSKGDKLLWFDQIKIPIRNDDGTNYDPDDFAGKLYKFLRNLGKQINKTIEVDKKPTIGSKIQFNLK